MSENQSEQRRGSPTLRSLGTAWLVIGLLGLVTLLVAYLLTDSPAVWIGVPLLAVFVMLGVMWRVQGRRHTARDEPPS